MAELPCREAKASPQVEEGRSAGDGVLARNMLKAARTTLLRTSAAFGLDHSRFKLDLSMKNWGLALGLGYQTCERGTPFRQRIDMLGDFNRGIGALVEVRGAVERMVWKVACAFPRPVSPRAWSVHPAAAIISAARTRLPNPADPATWLARGDGQIHLPDGGHVAGAVFEGREGVLLLQRATLIDANGDIRARLRTDGAKMVISIPQVCPEVCMVALRGRSATHISDVFAADPRGKLATIVSVGVAHHSQPHLVIALADRLVPLLASATGGEHWRPPKAQSVLGPPTYAVPRDLMANYT